VLVQINGKPTDVWDGCSLQDLMLERKMSARAVITELNGQIVQPEQRIETKLKPNDKLEMIHILGGG
jgi:thiamine biosynthesis protein ThiS